MPDLLVFALVIGGLIVGHELGHFLAARAVGIHVEEFGLGFPPRLTTLFHWRGTRFTLNAIPLGGFVRIAGEDDPTVEGGLAAASKRARAFVLLAGPAANVILAFFAFTAAFRFAAPDTGRVIFTQVEPASPAEQAGLRPGDEVLQVDDVRITGFRSLQEAIAERLGQPTKLTILRDGQQLTVELVPRPDPPQGQGPIGVLLGNPTQPKPWPEAVRIGAQSTWIQFREILRLPARIIRGQIDPQDARLTGLKGMYDMLAWAGSIDRSSQRPFLTLNLIGVISAGLALANMLPFPALDGGRLAFVLWETVTGRRISPRYEGLAHTIGFIILLALLLYVNLLDFIKPIPLP